MRVFDVSHKVQFQPSANISESTVLQSDLSSLERQTELMICADKIHMMYANPNSEYTLATLARLVTFLIRGVSLNPNVEIRGNLQGKILSELDVRALLELRRVSM